MRNYPLIVSFLLLLLHSVTCLSLSQKESDTIFDESNLDHDKTLEASEIDDAILKATHLFFSKADFYNDEALIRELVREFTKDSPQTLNKDEFKITLERLSTFVEPFRKKIYIDVLKDLQLEDILNDELQLSEVISKPNIYGITYSTHKSVYDEIDRFYKDALEQVNELKGQFQNILEKSQRAQQNDEL